MSLIREAQTDHCILQKSRRLKGRQTIANIRNNTAATNFPLGISPIFNYFLVLRGEVYVMARAADFREVEE